MEDCIFGGWGHLVGIVVLKRMMEDGRETARVCGFRLLSDMDILSTHFFVVLC